MSRWNEYDKMLENRCQAEERLQRKEPRLLPEPSEEQKQAWSALKNNIMSQIVDGTTSGPNWNLDKSGWVDVGGRAFHIKNHEHHHLYLKHEAEKLEAQQVAELKQQEATKQKDAEEKASELGFYLFMAVLGLIAFLLMS